MTRPRQRFRTASCRAEETLRLALRKHPSDSRALGLLGVILDAQNRFEEAERCYRRALPQAPTSAPLHNNLRNYYLVRGLPDRERAAQVFEAALRQRPDDVDCLAGLARVHLQQGKDDRAAACLVRAQR
jgi:Flp pilus assembly protein TadD